MGRRWPAGRVMRVLAIAPLLLAGLLAGAGQAAAATAATCPDGSGGQPSGPGTLRNDFNSVTVLTACDVWAVGGSLSGTLIEHWTGGPTWTTVASPSPGDSSELTAVRAVSATDIWAVGWYKTSSGTQLTLIEHWDGSAWTQVNSPNPGSSTSRLFGVAATSGTSAWAVGSYDDPAGRQFTLILRWDGSAWTKADSPNPADFNVLGAVSATSATNAWAVGIAFSPNGNGNQTLIEHWDGSAWTLKQGPSPETHSGLFAVAATATNNAWAVGYSQDSSGARHALIERWNGSSWAQAPISDGGEQSSLDGVAATSAGNAWAVGDSGTGSGTGVLHWDGSVWTPVTRPAPASGQLSAVATTPGGFVWAVGSRVLQTGPVEPLAVRVQDVPRIQVVVQGPDAHVYKTGPVEGLASTGVNLAAGTSPAAAGDGQGGVEAAWQAAGTHHLFTLDPAGHQADTGLSVAAGTSPAVAALPGGGFQIAFVSAADGQVWVLGPGGAPARAAAPGLAVAAGTSPSIASNSAGAVRVAVHAAGSDHLWLIGTTAGGTAREIGVSLAAGTSPAIAAGPTGFTAAFVTPPTAPCGWRAATARSARRPRAWRSRPAPVPRSPPTPAPGSRSPSTGPTATCGWSATTAPSTTTPRCRC